MPAFKTGAHVRRAPRRRYSIATLEDKIYVSGAIEDANASLSLVILFGCMVHPCER